MLLTTTQSVAQSSIHDESPISAAGKVPTVSPGIEPRSQQPRTVPQVVDVDVANARTHPPLR